MKNMHREHICSRVHVFYFRLIGRQPYIESRQSRDEMAWLGEPVGRRQPYIESRQSRDEMAWLEEPQGGRQPVSEMKRSGIELRHG